MLAFRPSDEADAILVGAWAVQQVAGWCGVVECTRLCLPGLSSTRGPWACSLDYQVLLPSQVEPAVRGRTGRRRVRKRSGGHGALDPSLLASAQPAFWHHSGTTGRLGCARPERERITMSTIPASATGARVASRAACFMQNGRNSPGLFGFLGLLLWFLHRGIGFVRGFVHRLAGRARGVTGLAHGLAHRSTGLRPSRSRSPPSRHRLCPRLRPSPRRPRPVGSPVSPMASPIAAPASSIAFAVSSIAASALSAASSIASPAASMASPVSSMASPAFSAVPSSLRQPGTEIMARTSRIPNVLFRTLRIAVSNRLRFLGFSSGKPPTSNGGA